MFVFKITVSNFKSLTWHASGNVTNYKKHVTVLICLLVWQRFTPDTLQTQDRGVVAYGLTSGRQACAVVKQDIDKHNSVDDY